MNTNFNILWLEDKKEAFDAHSKLVKTRIENDLFLDVHIHHESTLQRALDQNLHRFDLIVVDYDLGGETFGTELVNKIKSEPVLTRVVFYSSQFEQLDGIVDKGLLLGVNAASRREVEDIICDVAHQIITNLLDADSLRGFFLAGVNQIELKMNELIEKSASDQSLSSKINMQKLYKKYRKSTLDFLKDDINKFSQIEAINSLINYNNFTFSKRARWIFHILLPLLEIDERKKLQAAFDRARVNAESYLAHFNEQVIDRRNILAHQSTFNVIKLFARLLGLEVKDDIEEGSKEAKALEASLDYMQVYLKLSALLQAQRNILSSALEVV